VFAQEYITVVVRLRVVIFLLHRFC